MSARPMPATCEVCETFPAAYGVGFPSFPNAVPGLPDHLHDACVFVCYGRACDLAAQRRAAAEAARHGITLKTAWRHWRFPAPGQIHPERITQ